MKCELNHRQSWTNFFRTAENVRYHRYQIEYIDRDHEVVCPRYTFANGTYVIVIPWFLIPGRPYPIQIYLYACSEYSSKLEMGQRGAAEATRKKFNLDTFSHSTVSRSFKTFEQDREMAMERRFGEELKPCDTGTPEFIEAAAKVGKASAVKDGVAPCAGNFPSVNDTLARRKEMAGFFREFLCDEGKWNIEATGRQFAENWHKKTRRLLL